ncbi:hypothetical protein ACA910_014622 [Epithemia clementina (nom. ined.)]
MVDPAAPLAVPAAPPAVVAAPPFALGPGRDNAVLNYADAGAVKLYNTAIAPLDTLFDGEADNIAVFLANVSNRARRFGWHDILTVPDDGSTNRNLIQDYGLVSMTNVQTRAQQYVGTPSRNAQNADMMYHFLIDSLESAYKAEVLLYQDDYTVTGTPDGICLLKKIIELTYIDTRATTSHIRDTLIDMTSKLQVLGGNVTAFNKWVKAQVEKLSARGASAPDLITHLWKTYKTAPNCEFVAYIKDLKNIYDDGRADYTSQSLMHLADDKYKAYIQSGEWGQPSKEQAEIVALTTKIDVLQKQLSGAKQSSNQRKSTKKEEAKPKTKGKADTTKKSGKFQRRKGKAKIHMPGNWWLPRVQR